MCTLILIRKMLSEYPLIVAANRDEKLARPAVSPAIIHHEPTIYAPLDLERMGTWIGVSDRGLFVGITNRDDIVSQQGRVSRGELVTRALLARDAEHAKDCIMKNAAEQYNGFQLLIADRRDAFVIRGDGARFELHSIVNERVIVLTSRATTFPDNSPRAKKIRERIRFRDRYHAATPRTLDRVLSLHEYRDPYGSVCVHKTGVEYGTRSSTIVRLNSVTKGFDVWHREGRACAGHFGEPFHLPLCHSGP